MYSTGNYTQKELAQQFNCSLTHMNKIINGKKWGASLSNNQAADQ